MTRRRRTVKPKPVKSAEEVYAALVRSRGLVSAFDRTLARQITNLLVEGRVLEAVKGLEHLPPVVRAESDMRTVSSGDAKQRVMQMIMSAVAAEHHDLAARAARGEELSERDQLRLRLAQLDEPLPPDEANDEAEQAQADAAAVENTALAAAQARIADLEAENARLVGRPKLLPPPTAANRPGSDAAPSNALPYDPIVNGLRQPPKSDAEIKAQMDRANAKPIPPSVMRTNPGNEPWRDYVSPTGEISMRPRRGRGFP